MIKGCAKVHLRILAWVCPCVLILLGVGWCQPKNDSVPCPNALISLPGASSTTCRYVFEHTQLVYWINADYPADEVLKTIYTKLKKQGWHPLKYDYLNPSIPSSDVRGWQQFQDDTTNPRTTVHSWQTQWTNQQHDILEYMLLYRYPVDAPTDLRTLHVVGIFTRAEIAAKAKDEIEKLR